MIVTYIYLTYHLQNTYNVLKECDEMCLKVSGEIY